MRKFKFGDKVRYGNKDCIFVCYFKKSLSNVIFPDEIIETVITKELKKGWKKRGR